MIDTERMIHIRLPESLHRQAKVAAATVGLTLEQWIAEAVRKELK